LNLLIAKDDESIFCVDTPSNRSLTSFTALEFNTKKQLAKESKQKITLSSL